MFYEEDANRLFTLNQNMIKNLTYTKYTYT